MSIALLDVSFGQYWRLLNNAVALTLRGRIVKAPVFALLISLVVLLRRAAGLRQRRERSPPHHPRGRGRHLPGDHLRRAVLDPLSYLGV